MSDLDHVTLASSGTNSAVGCDDLHQTPTVHPALYFFLFAQLLVGFGGCGLFILTPPYIDENAPQTKSALYLGISVFYRTDFERVHGLFSVLSLCHILEESDQHYNTVAYKVQTNEMRQRDSYTVCGKKSIP